MHRPWRGLQARKLDWEVHRSSYILTSIPRRAPKHDFGIFFFLLPDTLVTAAARSQS